MIAGVPRHASVGYQLLKAFYNIHLLTHIYTVMAEATMLGIINNLWLSTLISGNSTC